MLCRKVGLSAFSRALSQNTSELTRGLAPSENVSFQKKQRRREAGNPEAIAKFSTEPLNTNLLISKKFPDKVWINYLN